MLRIGIVAGEASGDYLGAELIKALKEKHVDVVVEGVGGSYMLSQGCMNLFPMDKLAVMGIIEVLGSYFELLSIRRKLLKHFSLHPPDVFIGIDAPDFNLGLEHSLRSLGIPTVHYVSPSIWAWRKYRIKKIANSVDLMLTLFPFEPEIYEVYNIPAKFVGHPLAEKIKMKADKSAARQRLGLDEDKITIGIMPGSRKSELSRLWVPFLKTADLCFKKSSNTQFISSLLDADTVAYCRQGQNEQAMDHIPLMIYQNRAHDVLEASDVVLVASGTITLEAMLFKKPMVVAYKLNSFSHMLVKMLTYINHASLPNLLARKELVPECLQNECQPEKLYDKIQNWLDNPDKIVQLEDEFDLIHRSLRTNSGSLAATAVLNLINVT